MAETMARTLLIGSIVFSLVALLPVTATAVPSWQPDTAPVVQHKIKLSDTVWLIEPRPGYGGNVAVSIGPDGILLVDDQLMSLVPKIRLAVADIEEEAGVYHGGRVRFMINSHYHYDHAGGNEAFGDSTTIFAHQNVRMRLAEGREAGSLFVEGGLPKAALPVITFEEKVTFHFNGEAIDAYFGPNPSHTDGDTVIFFRTSNVMHTGDQYVNLYGYPFIDLDVGGSATGLRDNIAQMLELANDDTRIIPGHGPLATKAELQDYHDRMDATIRHVAAMKADGKTLAEAQEAGLPEEYEKYIGFQPVAAWINSIYASLP